MVTLPLDLQWEEHEVIFLKDSLSTLRSALLARAVLCITLASIITMLLTAAYDKTALFHMIRF